MEDLLEENELKDPVGLAFSASDPYDRLRSAILIRAIKDYRRAKKKSQKQPQNHQAAGMMKDVEAFLRSPLFAILYDVPGDTVLQLMQ